MLVCDALYHKLIFSMANILPFFNIFMCIVYDICNYYSWYRRRWRNKSQNIETSHYNDNYCVFVVKHEMKIVIWQILLAKRLI